MNPSLVYFFRIFFYFFMVFSIILPNFAAFRVGFGGIFYRIDILS